MGRFKKESRRQEASIYESVRRIKLKKVKGSYGTYVVKKRILSEEDMACMYGIIVVVMLAIVF
ncbi:hypothetical protein M3204_03375 [Mesobacillus subterraneus]|nr:hypothetical protein [Mesobacillus subterraneus]